MSTLWFSDSQAALLRQWWYALQPEDASDKDAAKKRAANPFSGFLGRGDRAALRRCSTAYDVLVQPAYAYLRHRLLEVGQGAPMVQDDEALAIAAGVAARVMQIGVGGNTRPFAALLGKSRADDASAVMSKLRFGQLQAAATPDEVFLRLRRAVDMTAGQRIDIAELGSDILKWMAELRGEVPVAAVDRVSVRWARLYFTEPMQEQAVKAAKAKKP